MTKPRTTQPPITATTTDIRIDERAHLPAGLVLLGGSAKLSMNMHIHTKLRIALAGIALSFSAILAAQDHLHKAPHGGVVADAGTHHIEMVVVWKEVHFYLLDTLGNTLPVDGLTGTAYIQYVDRTTANHELIPHKKGYLRTMLDKQGHFSVVASVAVPSGFVSAQLNTATLDVPQQDEQHNASDGHTH